ncbi:unnamed protein product [Musa acuminata subsp. malaccensis]|uniref:(wild Malaysian banana) hypothetical protein n=1 Tax=Musa acuminata subsp. malaccensis TaxID=214687 RepID=A0A804HTX3_MUSAM|nr:unnamed protein product [Musa acuminata subsp. malaccensis]
MWCHQNGFLFLVLCSLCCHFSASWNNMFFKYCLQEF